MSRFRTPNDECRGNESVACYSKNKMLYISCKAQAQSSEIKLPKTHGSQVI